MMDEGIAEIMNELKQVDRMYEELMNMDTYYPVSVYAKGVAIEVQLLKDKLLQQLGRLQYQLEGGEDA